MKTGLVLGKFAPLHRGHQYVIETALQQVEQLYIMVYACDELPDIPMDQRIGWIEKLYPEAQVIPAPDGPRETGYADSVMAVQEDYILKKVNGVKIDAFFSSEPYGAHVSRALNAVDCRVDEARENFPVSASQIRQDAFKNKKFIPPTVYEDLIEKIVFLGAPSTGKTTISQALAKELNTEWVAEYGRTYWEENQSDRRLTPEQLLYIATTHNSIEDETALQANKYLICDTNAFTTWHFAVSYHDSALAELEQLADKCKERYKYVFLCADDIPYEDTWERSGEGNRKEFQDFLVDELSRREIPYIELRGSLAERIEVVLAALAK